MARREDHHHRHHHHQQIPILYATILPSTASTNSSKSAHGSPATRKQTELERAKAVR
jgi:hypothetical protein